MSATSPEGGTANAERKNPPSVIISSDSADDLIQLARASKPDFIIEPILGSGDILVLHGFEDTFKSVLVVQMAADIAEGKSSIPSLRVPRARRVGVIETEIHPEQMGRRLARMFPNSPPSANLRFMSKETLRGFKRAKTLETKFAILREWAKREELEVLVLDTANDFFRGQDNPNEEMKAGEFFDRLRDLDRTCIVVRHDRKSKDGQLFDTANENIRGSAEFKEDPEVIFHIARKDRRTNEAQLECGKMRYGSKPEPLPLWFDAGSFRMITENPVLTILGNGWMLRSRVVSEAKQRFGLSERSTDEKLSELKPMLEESQAGHSKQFRVRRTGPAPSAKSS